MECLNVFWKFEFGNTKCVIHDQCMEHKCNIMKVPVFFLSRVKTNAALFFTL